MQFESAAGGADTTPYVPPNQALGIEGDIVRAPAVENDQRELVHLIEDSGLTPTRADLTQVKQAIDARIAAAIAAATLTRPGTLRVSAESSPGPGEFLCNGAAISRVDYSALFAAIGTTWGAGDTTTTFNLPDLRGRALIVAGQGVGLTLRNLGDMTIGEEAHALTEAENGPHHHTVPGRNQTGDGVIAEVGPGPTTTNITSSTSGSGTPHNNMQPSAVVNVFIHV